MLRELFEQALMRRKEEYGAADPRTAQAARDLGLFLRSQGDSAGARDALAEAVRIDEKSLGPAAAQTLADVADLAGVSGPGQAEPLWRRAAESPDGEVAARALAVLGQSRETASDSAGAAKLYRQALDREEAAGPDSARVAVRLNALARVVDLDEAIALLDRAVNISRRRLGPRHPETATLELNLAGSLLKAGHADQAAQLCAGAMSAFEEALGADHPRTAAAATFLGHALRAKGDLGGAERMYRRALAIDEHAEGPRSSRTLTDARTLAGFLREIGKIREAADLEKKMLSDEPR